MRQQVREQVRGLGFQYASARLRFLGIPEGRVNHIVNPPWKLRRRYSYMHIQKAPPNNLQRHFQFGNTSAVMKIIERCTQSSNQVSKYSACVHGTCRIT